MAGKRKGRKLALPGGKNLATFVEPYGRGQHKASSRPAASPPPGTEIRTDRGEKSGEKTRSWKLGTGVASANWDGRVGSLVGLA